ncbi:5'-3' exoribonuclease 1-like isoform X1 [Palaemon carinicauda]|uniref:5'-3' exoribonuclease 1-like isoform X1 n=1 Tax=Palaemon carinicauda TaxID=392227 RepID=UPI0035B66011
MGVPKFYRWISERYPCLSEVVKEYQIPEFDNLYLDMNGIIHVCSHPNDNDPHFRMTEEKMFKDIFHYIEVLFRLIQPRKVFFMAVDGVAPRAKMNQQRGRRFRSAREAVDAEKKARDRGEVLPTEERFDSNCITPGTEFMARLDTHLQYFVTHKISHDKLWQNCKVIYSGHETPGEGEHKIMEYIRYTKSQPNYNPNTRHCLYGLDADLIMLGLTSHEPHFSLLREEVRFGGKENNSRTPTAEDTTFHLLHLSLMREYISYEFHELKSTLPFPFDLENVIDDWVLMGFLVGNDFIPHLPNLHINKEALPNLYQTYKSVLPSLGGYLNNGGKLNLERFEKFVEKLAEMEVDHFQEMSADLKYFNAKKSKNGSAFKVNKGRAAVKELVPMEFSDDDGTDDDGENDIEKTLAKLGLESQAGLFGDDDEEEGWEEDEEFRQHKREYYMTKMNYENVDADVLVEQATCYVRGIQWILNYYYNGICSWSWYYPYHYAPYVSDIRGFSDLKLHYDMGKPFLPYEQLLAVLPPLSKKHLPEAYQGLMTKEDSPLKEYYPDTFQTDLNGKQQDWEAVVLIPFIDEKRLLDAMAPCNEKLTEGQKLRNIHGPMYVYSYTPDNLGEYKAPTHFPSVGVNHASVELVHRDKWEILPEKIFKGLCPRVKEDLYFAGFPTLKHITHTFHIAKEAVKVFQQNSRGENFILDITELEIKPNLKDLANQLVGKTVFVSWPHLVEAKVTAIASMSEKYYRVKGGELNCQVMEGFKRDEFVCARNGIATQYHDRWGINVGDTDILVYAAAMTGRRYAPTPNGRVSLEKSWSSIIQPYAYQTIVKDIAVHDPGYREHFNVEDYFSPRTKVFMLGQPYYGCLGEVIEINPSHKGRIRVVMTDLGEPNFEVVRRKQDEVDTKYMPGYIAAQKVGISTHLLARLTGTVFLLPPSSDNPGELDMKNRLNIGLNLKNNKRSEEVVGYTRKVQDANGGKTIWLYSPKTVESIMEYQSKFPEIFDHLSEQKGDKDIFYQDEVFGKEQHKERVSELTAWLKESDFAKAFRQKCGTPCLDEAVVSRLVEEVDKISAILARSVKMQVRPHLLFKPNPLQGSTPPDPSVTYELFDRVTNCREGFSVPLGARGTVIGIHLADKETDVMYDILFDEAFEEGLTLAGPATAKRCYRLHSASLINLSHGNRYFSTGEANGNGKSDEPKPDVWKNNRQDQNHHYNHQNQQRPEKQGYSPHPSQQTTPYQPPQGSINKNQGYNCTPPKNNPGYDVASPQPPDPNQLPSPSALYVSSQTKTRCPDIANGGLEVKTELNHSGRQGMVEIRSSREVDCVVFGTYYATWNKILQQGIGRMPNRNCILCFSYIPRIKPGPKAFQLLIFVDVTKALADGIRFYRVNEQLISCTGDSQGLIRPKYFIKVVDCESNTIIYTPQYGFGTEAIPTIPANPGRQPGSAYGQAPHPGRGRGRAITAQQPQGLRLYENIWSQVQREDNERLDKWPVQGPGISNAAPVPAKDSGRSDYGRTEVSVEDIFRGAAMACAPQVPDQSLATHLSPDLLSMFKPPQQTQCQGVETNAHKEDSPVKSAFVPTQVIRNRTPRKPKPGNCDDMTRQSSTNEGQSLGSADAERPHAQQTQRHVQQSNGNDNRPRRKVRNRLAVKFGQPFVGDT